MSITSTLIIQIIVFLLLVWFTMSFVWPPIARALDARAQKVAEGLAAADKARSDLVAAERRIEQELQQARAGAAEVRSGAEKQAAGIVEKARVEAAAIIAAARKSAEDEAVLAAQKARDQLRDQVAVLAVAGAARILRQEVDAAKHADLLANLKNELN